MFENPNKRFIFESKRNEFETETKQKCITNLVTDLLNISKGLVKHLYQKGKSNV
jgi:hypothetical protein